MANTWRMEQDRTGQGTESKCFALITELQVEGIWCCQHHILPLFSCTRFTYLDHLLFQMERDSGYSSTAELQKQVKAQGHLLGEAFCRCFGRLDVLNHLLREVTDILIPNILAQLGAHLLSLKQHFPSIFPFQWIAATAATGEGPVIFACMAKTHHSPP